MACQYTVLKTGTTYSATDFDDYLKSLPHETLAKYSPVVAALLGKSDNGIRFSRSLTPETKNLVIIHNTSIDGLEHTNKIGGMPSPSLAIANKDFPLTGFGEISLIGSKENFAPSAKNKTYNADIYSARYPSVVFLPNERVIDKFNNSFFSENALQLERYGEVISKSDLKYSRGVYDYLKDKAPVMYAYLESIGKAPDLIYEDTKPLNNIPEINKILKKYLPKAQELKNTDSALTKKFIAEVKKAYSSFRESDGKRPFTDEQMDIIATSMIDTVNDYARTMNNKPKVDIYATKTELNKIIDSHRNDYKKWINDTFGNIAKDEKIDAGETPSGNRKYIEHNIDNVLKIMKKGGTRNAENFNYGIGNVRAAIAKEYKKLAEIQKDRDKIVSGEEMKKLAEVTSNEYSRISNSIRDDFSSWRLADDYITDVATNGFRWAEREYGVTLSDEKKADITNLFALLRDYPTEYFEIKPQRIVNLHEFSGAVVPNGAEYDKAIEILKKHGVTEIQRYNQGDEKARAEAVNKFSDLHFSKSPQQTTSSTVAQVKSWLSPKVKAMLDSGKLRVVQSVNDLPVHLREAGAAMLHTAWHGSPHDHNGFDMSKIGTGEGAQVFGYGHYFTDEKEIGEFYKAKLSEPAEIFIGGVKVDSTDKPHIRAYRGELVDRYNSYMQLAEERKNPVNKASAIAMADDVKGLISALDNGSMDFISNGKLYEVELAPTQDEYLDWDKPLSGQSDTVKNALKHANLSETTLKFDGTGAAIYEDLSSPIGKKYDAKKASAYLHSLGIRGIRYKADKGNSDANNYVIFSDDDITITNKYSQLNGIQGLYDATSDKTYLVADMLTKDNVNIVLSHELFHRFYAADPKAKTIMNKMMWGARESFDQASRGKGTKTELSAYQRVIKAKTPEKDQVEEYLAYQISSFLENPKNVAPSLANLIKNWIASIRMALLRYGMDMGFVRSLTPRDLVALSQYGSRSSNGFMGNTSIFESIVNKNLANTEGGGSFRDRKAFFGKLNNIVNPNSGKLISIKSFNFPNASTASFKGGTDTAIAGVKFLSDLLKSESFGKHGFGGLNIETQNIVMETMLNVAHDLKILDSVIKFIPVDMMNNLANQQVTPNMLLHDMAMLKKILSIDSDLPIAIRSDVASTLAYVVTILGAKKLSNLGVFNNRRGFSNGDTTVATLNNNKRRVADIAAIPATKENARLIAGDLSGGSIERRTAGSTINDRHDVTPNSNVMLGDKDVDASLSPSIIPKIKTEYYPDFADSPNLLASTSDKDLETLLSTYVNENGAPSRAELAEALRQYRTIESQYFNTDGTPKDGAMIAPNGEPTKLNKMQWITVRTENFKNWFGDWEDDPENASKVVDENGEPKSQYHTGSWKDGIAEMDGFHLGVHFGTKEAANTFTRQDSATTPVFLNLRNPLRTKDFSFGATEQSAEVFHKMGILTDKEYYEDLDKIYMSQFGYTDLAESKKAQEKSYTAMNELFISALKRKGYDSIVYENEHEDIGSDSFIALNPNQIKSSIANTGVFGKSNDIRFSIAPRRLTDAWIDWWNNSMFAKTDKETGRREPIKFYHATNAPDLTFFDKEKLGSNTTTHATSGLGFFFSPIKEDVQQYGSNLVEVYLSANKVYSVNSYDLPMFNSLEEAKKFSKSLQKKGYDGIWLKDAKYAIVFESNQAKLTSNEEPTQSPDIRASFAGENAQTADKYQLATAKKRLANGENAEQVRKDTGWFKGVDGKWRFEINDSDASLKNKPDWTPRLSALQAKYNAARDKKNQSEELRNAFLRERGESPSRIKPETKKMPEFIALNKDFKSKASAAEKARDAVTIESYKESEITVSMMLNHPALFSAYPSVANIKVVLNDSIPATDASYTKEFNKIELSSKSNQEQVLSNLLHEIQHSIQFQEGFAIGGSQSQFNNDELLREANAAFSNIEYVLMPALFDEYKQSNDPVRKEEILQQRRELNALKAELKKKTPEELAFDKYKRLAGEIEARNTQARLGLTAEQRRNTPPSKTQDIPDSEAIVVWNGTEMRSEPANADSGVRFSVASDALDYLTNQPRNVTSAIDLQSLIDSKKLPKQKRFNTDSIIENFVDSSHPLRVWSRILPDTLSANKMLDNFDRASGVKATIEKQAAIKFKRQISSSIKDFAKEQGVNFDAAMEIIGNWASMRYALESGQKWIYSDAEMTTLKADIETKFGKANLEQAIQPVLDMNQWRLSELDGKEGKLSGTDLTNLQTPNYVPLLDNHAINDSYAELENSAKFVGFKDFRNSLKLIHKGLFDDIKSANPALSDDEINAKIKEEYELNKTKKGVVITNPEAQLAMTDLSNEPVPSILKPIAAFTRFQSKMVTAFLVGFAPTNMVRDVAERTENLRTRTVAGYESVNMNSVANQAIKRSAGLLYNIKKVMMNVLAEGTILEDKFKADNTNHDVQDFREYLKLGASSTYGDLLADDKQGLAKELKKATSIPQKAMDVLLLWNNAFEMISGFSAYQSMVAHGIDKKSAAATSLNLMNFRKRGKVMSPLRALYMFAQPIAIGGHQLAKTLSTRRGLMRLAAYTVASMVLYSLLRGVDGDDDELGYNRMDESSNFSLYRNIRIPLGDGEYFDVPVGFGMQQLAWSHGVNFVRTALGTMTTSEMLGESSLLWVKSTAPVSPAEGSIMKNPAVYLAQTFTPQVARPVMNIALDVNAFMSPLTNSRYERTDKAKALQGRANTPQEYKTIAEMLGKAGIDMYPEQIRELMRGYGAGLFNEAIKYFIENPAKEDKGLKTVSPLIDRWYKVSNDDQIKQKLYYNARDKMNAASVVKSNGAELTTEQAKLATLGDILKKREASTRGKYAAATKAEKAGQLKRAELLRKVADIQRNKYMDFAFDKMKEITG